MTDTVIYSYRGRLVTASQTGDGRLSFNVGPLPLSRRVACDIVFGHLYGYPRCCITAFAHDIAAGRFPAVLRPAPYLPFVPCPAHHRMVRHARS